MGYRQKYNFQDKAHDFKVKVRFIFYEIATERI